MKTLYQILIILYVQAHRALIFLRNINCCCRESRNKGYETQSVPWGEPVHHCTLRKVIQISAI